MIVKIIKHSIIPFSGGDRWYKNNINEIFHVKYVDSISLGEDDFYVVTSGRYTNYIISLNDTIDIVEMRNKKLKSL